MRRPPLRRLLICVVGFVTMVATYRVVSGSIRLRKSQTAPRSHETASVEVDREEHRSKSVIPDLYTSQQTTIPWTIAGSEKRSRESSENRTLKSSEIYISVKTTSRFHELRLAAQMATWMTMVEPRQVYYISIVGPTIIEL